MAINKLGKQTLLFSNKPVVVGAFSTMGTKEGQGPLGKWCDRILSDDKCGEKTWEKAETSMLEDTMSSAIASSGKSKEEIDILFTGDLINQIMASSYVARNMKRPFIGLYGACSTMTESLLMASSFVNAGYADYALAAASSHFCTAERQFRMPLEHGNQRPPSAQWTVTGSGSMIIGNYKEPMGKRIPRVTHGTVGRVIDKGINDVNMMGAAMAPAAIDTLITHFQDTGREPAFYDMILTGDLGVIGKQVVYDSMQKKGYELGSAYNDCGVLIFDQSQDTHSGGSGCGCSASVFCGYIYKHLKEKKLKNVLLLSTGALLSTISTQQGESIPGIAHAIAMSMED